MGCLRLTYKKNNLLQVVHQKGDHTFKKKGLGSYRYAYQGQEKDPETGKEAFELRLWDGRIGRWLTTDPAGQYFSPYMAMGNNPISSIDPDGAKDIRFDADGNIMRDADGNIQYFNDTFFHNLWYGTRLQYQNGDGGFDTFTTSHQKQDVKDIIGGNITTLVHIDKSHIKSIMTDVGAFSKDARAKPISWGLKEGTDKLDFAGGRDGYIALRKWNLYLAEGENVAHNSSNFGNFLTASALSSAGIYFKTTVLAGAHFQALTNDGSNGYPSQFDSADDQRALSLGFDYAIKQKWNPRKLSSQEANLYFGRFRLQTRIPIIKF